MPEFLHGFVPLSDFANSKNIAVMALRHSWSRIVSVAISKFAAFCGERNMALLSRFRGGGLQLFEHFMGACFQKPYVSGNVRSSMHLSDFR